MTNSVPAQRFQTADGRRDATSMRGIPITANSNCRVNPVKKSSVSLYDEMADDDNTITRPKPTRNSVVPRRRK